MGRIERPPNWILKYRERIEKGAITVEEILEEENKIRKVPIKRSSVTRAINAMGYPITGLRIEKKEEEEEEQQPVETRGEPERIEKGPGWLQKYRERIEQGTITVEEILGEENKIREVPIKRSSVTRAINATGYPLTGLRMEKKEEEEEEEEQQPVETRGEPERIEKGPGWLQKYHDRIVRGTITVEEILAEENKIREVPIKRSSVTRAINAMGYPLTGLRIEKKEEEEQQPVETRGEPGGIEKGPGWLQKYHDRIVRGTITVEEILAEENKIRKVPIKRSSVTRAINSMGYPITGLRIEKKGEVKEVEKPKKEAEAVVYSSSIGKISEETTRRFNAMKKSWEDDLGKPLPNDYFVNILLALATLVEHGKVLTPMKR